MIQPMAIRPARPEDAPACAAILNAWIDEMPWMPRVHPHEDVEPHYREFFLRNREVTVADDGATVGYLALDVEQGFITSFFLKAAARGAGVGKRLLDDAKAGAEVLQLWTFAANEGARRFYEREGFAEADGSDGDNEEGTPDILNKWLLLAVWAYQAPPSGRLGSAIILSAISGPIWLPFALFFYKRHLEKNWDQE